MRARLTDEDLRRALDREGLDRAIRLREQGLKMERGIGRAGRTYTLYDKTDRVLDWREYVGPDDAPYNKPARGITLAEVDEWIEAFENCGIEYPDPETLEVMKITNAMELDELNAIRYRLIRARGGQP
jgi:hypothetical protein